MRLVEQETLPADARRRRDREEGSTLSLSDLCVTATMKRDQRTDVCATEVSLVNCAHDTCGFQSAKVPFGFRFHAHTCSW
jgi:hypothetical protein